jgi:hypothetical protein
MTTITTAMPSTNFQVPTDAQLRLLLKTVLGAHEGFRPYVEGTEGAEAEFGRAFTALGFTFRTAEPVTTRFFVAHLDDCNDLLHRHWSAAPVSAAAFMLGVYAHGDAPVRLADPKVGQLTELGLDPDHEIPCSNAWRQILEGRPLKAPLPPRREFRERAEPTPVRVFRQERPGDPWQDAPLLSDAPLWR